MNLVHTKFSMFLMLIHVIYEKRDHYVKNNRYKKAVAIYCKERQCEKRKSIQIY